jgi:hypothetical protein
MRYPAMIEDPQLEDSTDFSAQEASEAVDVASMDDWVKLLLSTPFQSAQQEMRRRGDDVFIRTRLVLNDGTKTVLIARANWLGR